MAKLDGILKSWMEERGNQINIKTSFLFLKNENFFFFNENVDIYLMLFSTHKY